MYNKSKNKILFVIFILIILLIISILVLAAYGTKKEDIEEYKISSNTITYDESYNYISISGDSVLKKEWDKNYYLKTKDDKYLLGTEPVIYDKSKNQVIVYGDIYQVYSNGDINKKTKKTVISNVSEFQFFKLNDRKYLVVGEVIGNSEFTTKNYLIVSIDKAGNALLVNNEINIKTINPLIINSNGVAFDVANEKLTIEDQVIDLKKINGSTNEYVEKVEEELPKKEPIVEDEGSNNNSNIQENSGANNSQIYNDIINQIVNISGVLSSQNKTNLYKNISLRGVDIGASYLVVNYSIVDPEEKYLSIFITLIDQDDNVVNYYIDKNSSAYRITGLVPNTQYKIQISYLTASSADAIIADSVVVLTNSDPTSLRITKIKDAKEFYYNVKMYNENEFSSASVVLTDCKGNVLTYADGTQISNPLDVYASLTPSGSVGVFENVILSNSEQYICLNLIDVRDAVGNVIKNNSYHKIKVN